MMLEGMRKWQIALNTKQLTASGDGRKRGSRVFRHGKFLLGEIYTGLHRMT